MGITITSREAFEQAIGHQLPLGDEKERKWQDWLTACEYQKRKDAQLCDKAMVDFERGNDFEDHACGAEFCRDAILHQEAGAVAGEAGGLAAG